MTDGVSTQDLIDYALGQGWGVKFRDLGRRHGQYSGGLITVNDRRRTAFVIHNTLAHEIGHATHDHAWTDDPDQWQRQEDEADIVAARLLITRDMYAHAEQAAESGDPRAIAAHLGVRPHYVTLWARHYATTARRHLRAC